MNIKINLQYVFALLLIGISVFSCRDDDEVRFPDFEEGVNARLLFDPNKTFIDLDNLQSTELGIDVYSENNNIERIDYAVVYTDFDSAELNIAPAPIFSLTQADFVNGKAHVDVSAQELATALGLPGGISWFEGADSFTFVPTATLTDGRVFTVNNSAPSITGGPGSSFSVLGTAFVGCASPTADITSKTYTASIITFDSDGNPPFNLPNTNTITGVTITAPGPEPFRYRVSSHDADWWERPDITDTDGGGADFYDICGTTIVLPIASFGFGGAVNAPGGSYDPETGVIVISWYNTLNDIFGVVTYTPEN